MPQHWRRSLALAAMILVVAPQLRSQQTAGAGGSIIVRVTSAADQRPVESARVFVVGTNFAGQTTVDGRVTFRNVPAAAYVVRVLRVGFAEQTKRATVTAGSTVTVDVAMSAAAVSLAAVVTTATGEQRRVEIGNATANIDAAKVVEASPVGSLNDLLNSRAPGVTVTSGTQTGTGARIRIRGSNSVSLSNEPIWIIDGIRMTSTSGNLNLATGSGGNTGGNSPSRVGDLNPDEIENIEIVKGPSAATLYGTDAANGVILVTTKKGRAGAPRWSLYSENGIVEDRNKYPTAYSLWGRRPTDPVGTSARTFCNLQRVGTGECLPDSTSALNVFNEKDLTPLDRGNRRQQGLQVSGGSDAVRYFVAAEDERELGVLSLPQFERQRFDSVGIPLRGWTDRPNQMNRRSLRANVNATLSPKLDLAVSTNFININQRYTLESNATAGLGSQAFGGPGTRSNGTVLGTPLNGYRAWTPGYTWQEKTSQLVNRFIWSAQANWRPFSWLANRATVGNDYSALSDENLLFNGEGPPLTAVTRLGSRGINRTSTNNLTIDMGSTAQYALSGLDLKTTVGAQYIGFRAALASTGSTRLAPASQNVGSGTQPVVAENTAITKTFGVFVEQAVAFRDRLFLTAAVRSDQNSAFGTNFQSVLYPKASVSYLVSEEGWWKAPSFVNSVRLRYAYGQSGVQPGPNDAQLFFNSGTTNIASLDQATITQASLGNDNIKPERSGEHETGFEAQMFGSRLTADFTYYNKVTKDALIAAILPPSYGLTATQLRNIGSVRNKGVEIGLTAQLVDRPYFGWDMNVSGSANSNIVEDLGDTPPQIGVTSRTVEGYPISGYWAAPITSYQDKNGDGILTYFADSARNEVFVADSAQFRGYATPRYITTVTNGFELFNRKLRISTLWDIRRGNLWYNNTDRIRCTRPNCSGRNNLQAALIDQATNIAANEHPVRTLDGFLQDGGFVRLREASVEYTVSPALAQRLLKARSLSMVLSGRNLRRWTNYRGIDPESGFNTTAGTEAPSEFQTIAPPSYFIFRFNLGY